VSALKQTQPSDQDDEEVEERAAIPEFEAGYNRKDAEQGRASLTLNSPSLLKDFQPNAF